MTAVKKETPLEKVLRRPRAFPALAYRPQDAADAIGVSVSTIYGMIDRGALKTVKFGTATVIRHEELVAILETGEPGRQRTPPKHP